MLSTGCWTELLLSCSLIMKGKGWKSLLPAHARQLHQIPANIQELDVLGSRLSTWSLTKMMASTSALDATSGTLGSCSCSSIWLLVRLIVESGLDEAAELLVDEISVL